MVCLVSSPASARDLVQIMEPETFICRKLDISKVYIVIRQSKIDGDKEPVTSFLDEEKASAFARQEGKNDPAGDYYVTWTHIRRK